MKPGESMRIKALTFNIKLGLNEISGELDFEAVAAVIRETGADIVNLNEVYGSAEFPSPESEMTASLIARLAGYEHSFFSPAIIAGGRPYGNAFLSRFPIKYAEIIPIPDPRSRPEGQHYESRVITKFILKPGDFPLSVYTSHFGLNASESENAVSMMTDLVNEEHNPFVCMGDFNLGPGNSLLAPLLAVTQDTSAAENLSFTSTKPEMRIDYILVPPGTETVSSGIIKKIVSDHFPYYAEFNIDKLQNN